MDLSFVYFLLIIQGFSYAARKAADGIWGPYIVQHRMIYLPGVFGGLSLSAVGFLLWVSTGADPMFSSQFIRTGLRIAFLCFNQLGLLFDIAYWLERFFMVGWFAKRKVEQIKALESES